MIALSFALGCAHYEYELTDPPDLARHIGKDEQRINLDPLSYRLVTSDNRTETAVRPSRKLD